jgi:hypothetical protein
MGRKRHTPEQMIRRLRQAEVELADCQSTVEVARKLGITEQTHYCRCKEFSGLRIDQAKRLSELEKEKVQLKKPLAEQALGTPSRRKLRRETPHQPDGPDRGAVLSGGGEVSLPRPRGGGTRRPPRPGFGV